MRCPNGTRKNKKTGNCEPTEKAVKVPNAPKVTKTKSPKAPKAPKVTKPKTAKATKAPKKLHPNLFLLPKHLNAKNGRFVL